MNVVHRRRKSHDVILLDAHAQMVSSQLAELTVARAMAAGGAERALAARERLESYVHARPRWVLQSGALAAALGAARRSAQHVARGVRPPPNDKRDECHGLAVHAVLAHHPAPWRAAAQLLKRGTWRLGFHPASVALFAPAEQPRGMVAIEVDGPRCWRACR